MLFPIALVTLFDRTYSSLAAITCAFCFMLDDAWLKAGTRAQLMYFLSCKCIPIHRGYSCVREWTTLCGGTSGCSMATWAGDSKTTSFRVSTVLCLPSGQVFGNSGGCFCPGRLCLLELSSASNTCLCYLKFLQQYSVPLPAWTIQNDIKAPRVYR